MFETTDKWENKEMLRKTALNVCKNYLNKITRSGNFQYTAKLS